MVVFCKVVAVGENKVLKFLEANELGLKFDQIT